MKVKSVTEHRYNGDPKPVDKVYELPEDLAQRAIAEGWVKAVVPKTK